MATTITPFVVPIHLTTIGELGAAKQALLQATATLRLSDPGIVASNRRSWHSQRDLHLSNAPAFQDLLARLRSASAQALANVVRSGQRLVMTECWAMVMDSGGWSAPHHHHPALWSGVVFIDAEHAASATPNEPDGKLELLSPLPLAESYGQPSGAMITPRDGQIVLFPGCLMHLVHPAVTERPRVSVSFNLTLGSGSPAQT